MKTVLLAGAFLLSSSFMMAQSQSPASTPPTLPQSQSQPSPDQNTSSPSSTMPSTDQSSQTSSSQSSMGSQSEGSAQKIEGCLSQGANGFTLADASGTTYNLTGDTSKLSSHVGEQVEVKGMPASGSAASSSASPSTPASDNASAQGQASAAGSNAGGASSAASASGQSFTVHSVKRVSKTCSTSQSK